MGNVLKRTSVKEIDGINSNACEYGMCRSATATATATKNSIYFTCIFYIDAIKFMMCNQF